MQLPGGMDCKAEKLLNTAKQTVGRISSAAVIRFYDRILPCRRSPFLAAPFLEGKPRPVLLRLFHPILADLPRDQCDVAEVDVDMIVRVRAGGMTVRKNGNVFAQVFRD